MKTLEREKMEVLSKHQIQMQQQQADMLKLMQQQQQQSQQELLNSQMMMMQQQQQQSKALSSYSVSTKKHFHIQLLLCC